MFEDFFSVKRVSVNFFRSQLNRTKGNNWTYANELGTILVYNFFLSSVNQNFKYNYISPLIQSNTFIFLMNLARDKTTKIKAQCINV